MDTSELLRRAWEAVEKSGVPESMHAVALQAAVEDLRAQEGGDASSDGSGGGGTTGRAGTGRGKPKARPTRTAKATSDQTETPSVDEDTFFTTLAHESGVDETDLRDVLSLSGGKVHVTPPTRLLGTTKAQQARTITSLVAGARAFGLGERPIDARAVRDEVKRKNAYDEANYSVRALGELQGFNRGGSSAEMVATSRWDRDFVNAVNQALSRTEDES
jgi:hypothetical protein